MQCFISIDSQIHTELTIFKEIDSSIDLMRNASARAAGLVYLDHEEVEITTSNGVTWKVYGTPVSKRPAATAILANQC